MKKLLAALLSFSILFSSVTPSLAQVVPAGRQVVKGAVSGGVKSVSVPAGQQALKGIAPASVSAIAPAAAQRVPAATRFSSVARVSFSSSLQLPPGGVALSAKQVPGLDASVERAVKKQMRMSGRDIRAAVKAGNTQGMAARILGHTNAAVREGLLRNEFVTVALAGDATAAQIAQAVSFYRQDLQAASQAFSKLPQGDVKDLLQILKNKKHPAYQTVLQSHQALSSAAALGILGSKADADLLVSFYKQASQSTLKDAAAVIAARGLLRQKAYTELNELAAVANGPAAFWNDLAAMAKEQHLPLETTASAAAAPAKTSSELALFLQSGCAANRLNADASRRATEEWLALGNGKTVARTPAVRETTAPAAVGLQVKLPEINLAQADLQAAAIPAVPFAAEEATASALQTQTEQTAAAPSSNSGALYSGLPVFAMGKAFKRFANWLRGKGNKNEAPAAQPAAEEVPGLHDDSEIHEVFIPLRSPEAPASADEVISAGETSLIPVSEKGFKLTLVDQAGIERILPVNLEISNRFRVKGYNRIAFTEHTNFKNGYVAELRNQEQEPLRMAHFYMRLQPSQVGALADLIEVSGVDNFSLKLESNPNITYKSVKLPVIDFATGRTLPIKVEMPEKAYPKNAQLGIMENGSLGLLKPGETAPRTITGMYVRLPKNQIANFVKVLQKSPTPFNVSVHPTRNRADLIMRDASLTNVSLGKTMGPVVNNALGIKVETASSMMFTINYILPGLASLLTPILKKYGEKKMMVLSLAMSSAAGILASAGGFYGFVEGLSLGPVSKGLFITALFLMSGSSILKQLVSNMLIRANRGEVILEEAKEAIKKSETEFTAQQKYGFALMGQRLKEFFTKKSNVSLKDVVLYNLSFVYKNVGTLAFLASPYLINYGVTLATGHNYGIDYSISFPIYAVYSSIVAWRVRRAKLRDAYSAKNLEQSQKNLQLALTSGSKALAAAGDKLTSTQIDDAARTFKDALDALVFADIKVNPGKQKSALYEQEKGQFLSALEGLLVQEEGMQAPQAKKVVDQIKASISVQENTIGNMLKMLKAPGVASLATAMSLATVHEFVVSSSFANAMKTLIDQGELANFLIACSLYVPLLVGRLGGNLISRRISADTMYILCSAFSALGTGVMATAGDSVAQMVAGAAIASFGIGNFFTQMYDYIMNLYPKQNREISSILSLTMAIGGLGAIPAGYLTAAAAGDAPGLIYAGIALGLSLLLTPGMMKNSSLIKGMKYEAGRFWKGVKNLFKRGGNKNGGAAGTAAGASLDDPALAH